MAESYTPEQAEEMAKKAMEEIMAILDKYQMQVAPRRIEEWTGTKTVVYYQVQVVPSIPIVSEGEHVQGKD